MMQKGVVPGPRSPGSWPLDLQVAERTDEGPVELLRSIGAAARRHKVKLTLWVVACVTLATVYAQSTPPTYTATAILLLEPRRQIGASGRDASGAATLDLNRADSELQVIRSERLLAAVFDSVGADHQDVTPQPPDWMRRLLSQVMRPTFDAASSTNSPAPPAGEKSRLDEGQDGIAAEASKAEELRQIAFQNFAKRFLARRVGQSYVIEISYASPDPALAARVANAAVSAYILQSVAFKADAAKSGAEFLQARVDSLSAQVETAAHAVKEGTIPANPTPDADARIIGAARQPLEPSAPRTGLIIALGGVVGLMSGLIATALTEGFNRKIRTAQELMRDTELPCLALVPSQSNWNGLSRWSDAEMDCLVVSHPASRFALAVRDMRTSIEIACSTLRTDKNLVVALVAWERGSGATLLSMNLAHLISRAGKHVTVFNSEENDTAGDMGTGERPAPDSLVDALASNVSPDQIRFSELDGISILRLHSSHAEMNHFVDFSDPRVARIVEFARGRGPVLLDLPPLSDSADALALAQHADAVVLIVAAGRTSADEVNDAMRSLRRVGANVIGAVLNRATA